MLKILLKNYKHRLQRLQEVFYFYSDMLSKNFGYYLYFKKCILLEKFETKIYIFFSENNYYLAKAKP